MIKATRHKLAVITVLTATCTFSSLANVLTQESFSYTGQNGLVLNGKNGGTGWGGSWVADEWDDSPRIRSTSNLTYPGYSSGSFGINTTGNYKKATRLVNTNSVGVYRNYLNASGKVGKDGTELWVSVVNKRENNFTSGGACELRLLRSGANAYTLSKDYDDGNVHLFVVHIEFKAGADTVTTYFDPDLSQTPRSGTTATTSDASFDSIQFQGAFWGSPLPTVAYDEIIVGETPQDIGFVDVTATVIVVR